LIAIGEAYWQNKQPDQAVKSLTKALSTRPDLLPAQRGLLNIATAEKRYTEAVEIARQVQKQRPNEAVGYLLEGDVEKARRSWDAAAAAYRTSLQKQPSTEGAVRMHSLFMQAGRQADADRFAASWEKDHPKDVAFVFYRGDLALQQKNFAEAESRYRTVSQLQPQNALALNNVAWLMVKQSKPGALPFAEKATELMPNQPALMDTLSLALAAEKRLPQALEVQKKAVALSQGDPTMRLNLARLLVQAGDKSAARTELQALEKLGTKFPEHGAVLELLKTVG
jgi:putative PEP-CTERM system TPR-repeat lipoprotein